MAGRAESPVETFRARRAREGFVRVEVSVHRDDAALLRAVASALSDPSSRAETRRRLGQGLARSAGGGLKALLAEAPFDGIDLDRSPDLGRDVDL